MKLTRIHIVVLSMSVLLLVSGASVRQPHPMLPSSLTALGGAARAHLEEAFGKLPLYFVENQGQIDGEVAYYVQGSDKTIYFSPQGVTFALTAPVTDTVASRLSLRPDGLSPATLRSESDPPALQRWAVKLDFVGANPDVRPVGLDQTEAVISYFRGPREEWQVGLPTYSRIAYHDLWPGIDLVYYGTVDRLKYEFIVHPGADPAQIRLAYRGADIASDEIGQLEVMTPIGGFADDAPTAYQEVDGQQVAVDIAYDLYDAGGRGNDLGAGAEDRSYSFHVGAYDPTRPLILDPAVIAYCGYIGGPSTDSGLGIAVDETGSTYIVGGTYSTETTFPVTVGPDLTYNGGGGDAFVAKVSSDGMSLEYCGYIGGSGWDWGRGIAVDGAGSAYVTGHTGSTEATFPVTVGPDLTYNGDVDAFVAKVSSDGTSLDYCGYIGGSIPDYGNGIAVDRTGRAYITGSTYSHADTFPVTVGPDLIKGGDWDAYVAKVSSDGTSLDYCGYIGGWFADYGHGIAVDGTGSAYVTGNTYSSQSLPVPFPVTVGPDLTYNGDGDAFVAKVSSDGTSLDYCGYIGGSDIDRGGGIAVDGMGSAYVTGHTGSTEATFPVTVGPDLTHNGDGDAFVAKVSSDGTSLDYCGYIGGSSDDQGHGIDVDGAGRAYAIGYTDSTEATFPVTVGPDLTHNGNWDAFVAKVSSHGTSLDYCSYIGGSSADYGYGIAVDRTGSAYVTGSTSSTETTFPVTVGPDLTHNGGGDAFVAKVSLVFSVSGYIRDDMGNPIPGVTVSADAGHQAMTDGDGMYTISDLPARVYVLLPLTSNASPRARIVRVPPNRTDQDFSTVPLYGTLTGQVVDRASSAAIADARVSAGGQVVHTTSTGDYVLTSILPGLHTLRISADGFEPYQQDVQITGNTTMVHSASLQPIPADGFYLPYPGGTRYSCMSGNLTTFSHQGTWSYAFDFAMQHGNKVVAADDGIVRKTKSNGMRCYENTYTCRNSSNYIRIRHADGTDTLYWHLKQPLVSQGDSVQRGQVIGESNCTGWCPNIDHLDFTRHKWDGWTSIPISFEDVPGDGVPQQGQWYTSGNYPTIPSLSKSDLTGAASSPVGTVRFLLTGSPTHTLRLWGADYETDVVEMRLATTEGEVQASAWLPFEPEVEWTYPVAYGQFRDAQGDLSAVVSDTLEAVGYESIQAAFVVSPTVCVGQGLTITNQTTPFCEQCTWHWDFGNGVVSTLPDPQFDYVARSSFFGYAAPGAYTIALSVTNVYTTTSVSHQVEAIPTLSTDFSIVRSERTITVTATVADADSWSWDFGDGATASGRTATHTYPTPAGVYPVQLTVRATNGCSTLGSQYVDLRSKVYLPIVLHGYH